MIKAKKKPIINKGEGFVYFADNFNEEHKVANFFTCKTARELLDKVKPFEIDGRYFITFDSETHVQYGNSHLLDKSCVRRWVMKLPQDYPFCISICDGVNAYSIFDTYENDFKEFKQLSEIFEDESIEKIAHNTKFDMHMLANAGLTIKGRLHDTVVMAKLANENRFSYKLKDLASKLKGSIIKFEYMVDNYKTRNKNNVVDYRDIPRDLLSEYANADVWNAFLVFKSEYDTLKEDNLLKLYDNECELMMALYAMERYGIKIDDSYETDLKLDLQTHTDNAEASIYEEAGRMFNINSGKQLYGVLMGLGVNKDFIATSDKGNPVLDAKALEKLSTVHGVSIVNNILEYRKYSKLLATYAVGIYVQRDADFMVHGNINQTEAVTGRMSITKPALQTLPKKDTRIRKVFIPSNNYSLWFMDLDQVEYRLFAHYAMIDSLLEQIKNGHDVHAATASTLFEIDMADLIKRIHEGDKEADAMRSKAKTLNFALVYGMGTDALAASLKITKTEAVRFKNRYFMAMPEAQIFINTVHNVIQQRHFVKNFYGRRRRLGSNDAYKAPNSLIQGCAADYIKNKMVDMYKYIQYNNLKTRLINVVHDEVVIEIHEDELEHAAALRWLLSDFSTYRCPITAGIERGMPSWGEKKEVVDVDFREPTDKGYLNYNVYDGRVFNINRGDN